MTTGTYVSQVLTTVGSTPGINTDATQASLIATGFSGAAFTVSGTFAGTVSFYGSADGGANWFPINVAPSASTTPVTSATAPGLFRANVSGYTHVSAQLSALTSGTPTVSIHSSAESASSLSGGGTGGGGGGPGTIGPPTNQVSLTTASIYNNPAAGAHCSGLGTAAIMPAAYGALLVTLSAIVQVSTANNTANVFVCRTTGSIPAAGAAIPGADTVVLSLGAALPVASSPNNVVGSWYDTNLSTTTNYIYYLAAGGSTYGSIQAGTVLEITER